MIIQTRVDFQHEKVGKVGIFSLSGKLSANHEDDLKVILMRALYASERAVINFKDISTIDHSCINLLKKAYCTSLRLKRPFIMTGLPQGYEEMISACNENLDGSIHFNASHSLHQTSHETSRF